MSITLIGNTPEVLVFKDPVARKPDLYRWWAERGMLRQENQVTGQVTDHTVTTAMQRVKAVRDMIGNSRTAKGYMCPDECEEYQRFVDGIVELCRRAHDQGRPDVPAHVAQKTAEIKAKRHNRMVVVPGLASRF